MSNATRFSLMALVAAMLFVVGTASDAVAQTAKGKTAAKPKMAAAKTVTLAVEGMT